VDLGLGVDNLFHGDKAKVRLRFSVINLTNKEALYNFLSTFSGTHFVTPRAYQVQVGVNFYAGELPSDEVYVGFRSHRLTAPSTSPAHGLSPLCASALGGD
jgi:hypothetical protein